MLVRRHVIGLLAGTLALPRGTYAEAVTLRVGYQKSGSLVILKQQRRLEAVLGTRGVAVQWLEFSSGPALLEALNAGAIDFGATGDTPPIFAQAAGVDLVYVGYQPVPGRSSAILVHAAGPIRDLTQLKGQRIAFTKGSGAHYQTVRTLATAGLSLADARPVYLQLADAGAAFRNGSVDAWTIWDPFYAIAERDPAVRVLITGEVGPTNSFILARRDYARRNPEMIVSLVREINGAGRWSETHRDELARIMVEVTGVDLEAQRVAAARGRYFVDFLTDAVVRRQQEVADTFFALRVLPSKIDVRAAAWTPPAEIANAGAKP